MCDPTNYSVEGDWKDFEFRTITTADYPQVQKIMDVFSRGEPILQLLGYSSELANDVWKVAKSGLDKNNGLGFLAIHKPTKKVAGVRITFRSEKDEHGPEIKYESLETSHVFYNIKQLEEEANICERYGVTYYAELMAAAVDPEFREQGLASEMYRRTLLLLRAKGYPAAQSMFTSPYTRIIANKRGFEEINRRYFKDFTTPDGVKFVHNAGDDQFGAVMTIKL